MSDFKGITKNTPPEAEAHIYAEDDAVIYRSIFGQDGVLNIGSVCAATVISNNIVRIADGAIVVDGHIGRIPYGTYVDCEIMNGQTGYNRNAIILVRFAVEGSGVSSDDYEIYVVEGTAVAEEAVDPDLTQGDLYKGEKTREFPLYRVRIEGLSIVAVEQLFEVIPTIPELQEEITELNGKLIDTGWILAVTDGSGKLMYRVKNGYCTINLGAGSATGILKAEAGVSKTIFTMPEEYRPPKALTVPFAWQSEKNSTINLTIEENGDVKVYSATESGNYYIGQVSYPI